MRTNRRLSDLASSLLALKPRSRPRRGREWKWPLRRGQRPRLPQAEGILIPGQTRNKRRQRAVPLQDVMKNREKPKEGVSNTDVGRFAGASESAACTIKKNDKAIMECFAPLL